LKELITCTFCYTHRSRTPSASLDVIFADQERSVSIVKNTIA